jgi:hypothetical protein
MHKFRKSDIPDRPDETEKPAGIPAGYSRTATASELWKL